MFHRKKIIKLTIQYSSEKSVRYISQLPMLGHKSILYSPSQGADSKNINRKLNALGFKDWTSPSFFLILYTGNSRSLDSLIIAFPCSPLQSLHFPRLQFPQVLHTHMNPAKFISHDINLDILLRLDLLISY